MRYLKNAGNQSIYYMLFGTQSNWVLSLLMIQKLNLQDKVEILVHVPTLKIGIHQSLLV